MKKIFLCLVILTTLTGCTISFEEKCNHPSRTVVDQRIVENNVLISLKCTECDDVLVLVEPLEN